MTKRLLQSAKVVRATLLALALLLPAWPSVADPGGTDRSIDEFIAAQGTFCLPDGAGGCLLIVPPVPDYAAWIDDKPFRCAMIDYAGVAAGWLEDESNGAISLGTAWTGNVKERPLQNGQVEVRVKLHTQNALTWVVEDCNLTSGNLLFGQRATEVLNGATPSLGDSVLEVVHHASTAGLSHKKSFEMNS